MPLHVITGRANSGKTGVVNARIFASLERGESPTLVLPSVADTRRAVIEFSTKAPIGVAIVGLQRWANGLWRLHGDGRRLIGDASRDAFVRRAIVETARPALRGIAETPGFSALIARTVAVMDEHPESCAADSEPIRGVALICAHYRELISGAGLIEAAEAWRALGSASPVLGGSIAVNRFAELDEPTVSLLIGLARSNEVTVALTWEDGFAPTLAVGPTVKLLTDAADTATHVPEVSASGELGELVANLYAGAGGLASSGAVRVGLAAGSDAEAALVARFVAEAVASGTPPERLVVAFPDLNAAGHRLATAFAAEGLGFDIDIARPVASMAMGRTLRGLLTLALAGGDRTTALGVLLGPHSDVAPETAAALDRSWRRSRAVDPHQLLADIGNQRGTLLGRAAVCARSLGNSQVTPRNGKKWQELLDLLLSAAASRLAANGSGVMRELAVELESDASAARAVAQAVGEMASVENTPFSAGDVRAALATIVAGGTTGERPGRVQVTEVARLRSRRFDTVILGGLTAGEMPLSSSDTLADELRRVFAPGSFGSGEERARFAFYQAVSRARHQLILVRRDADDSGTPVRPSVLWEEVVDAYRADGEGADEWPLAGPPRVRVGAADIAVSAPVFTRDRRELRQRAAGGRCSIGRPVRGELKDSNVLEELCRITVFSATEIEAYLGCPYRWFYERVVRPEDINVEVDARTTGTIAHGLLKTFYEALPSALGEPRVTPTNTEDAALLLAEVVAGHDLGITAQGLSEELDLARATRWVADAVADDAYLLPGFVPSDHELSFGGPGEAAIELGGVGFVGRIDRIDTSERGVFVTDYKSSRHVIGHEKFAAEAKVQAVVYALVAREASGLPVAGSVYRSLRSRQMRGFWRADLLGGMLSFGHEDDSIGEARFGELVGETAALIETAVSGIRAGRVPREPADKKTCGFCVLKTQCEGTAQ